MTLTTQLVSKFELLGKPYSLESIGYDT